MKTLLAFLFAASIASVSDAVKSTSPASASAKVQKASFHLVWWDGMTPTGIEDLRLSELEDAAGISHFIWEMEVPAGKKMVLHFSGKGSASPKVPVNDWTWAINGPLAPSFTNRISLVRRMTNNDLTAQFLVRINSECAGGSGTRGINAALAPLDVESGWDGDWGATESPVAIPGIAWEMHLGTKAQPNQVDYKLEISLAPADPAAETGEIVWVKK